MNKLLIIKIGGNVLDDTDAYQSFLRDFAMLTVPRILVHGGGKMATKLGEQLGIESEYVNGRRITDEATRDVVTMVYGGLINRQVVAKLQALHCNAIGFTGADGNLIRAVRRPVKEIDFGFVGDVTPDSVNTSLLIFLLKQGLVPVFAPLTHADGEILNTNADTVASVLAIALSKHFDIRLIYCFDKKGVLTDIKNDDSVIHEINRSTYSRLLADGALADGILPKLENAFSALQAGVKEVLIGQASDLIANTHEETAGTLITK